MPYCTFRNKCRTHSHKTRTVSGKSYKKETPPSGTAMSTTIFNRHIFPPAGFAMFNAILTYGDSVAAYLDANGQ